MRSDAAGRTAVTRDFAPDAATSASEVTIVIPAAFALLSAGIIAF